MWSADDVAAIRAGERRPGWHPQFPREDDRDVASLWREGDPWSTRSVVVDGVVVGSIGFFAAPEPAADGQLEAEVGYGLVEDARGRGLMTDALATVLRVTDAQGVRVRASVEPTNARSLKVLAACGFTDLRGSDEDGHLVLARPVR
nr:GNAT family N-acetyltransferase [Nocardioides flavescens]